MKLTNEQRQEKRLEEVKRKAQFIIPDSIFLNYNGKGYVFVPEKTLNQYKQLVHLYIEAAKFFSKEHIDLLVSHKNKKYEKVITDIAVLKISMAFEQDKK